MSLTQIAVLLTGIWLVLFSQNSASSLLTLIFGIVVAVLVILDVARVRQVI